MLGYSLAQSKGYNNSVSIFYAFSAKFEIFPQNSFFQIYSAIKYVF